MNKYAAFDSSAINYLRATKGDRIFEELKQLRFKVIAHDKVIQEQIFNCNIHERASEVNETLAFFVNHEFKIFGFLPNSDEDLYKPWNNNRFQNRLKPISVYFMNKMIESSKTLSMYEGSKENIRLEDQLRQTKDILYCLAMKELFNKEREYNNLLWSKVFEDNGESTDIKYNELLQHAKNSIFPSKIEYPKQGKGLLTFENGESVEISKAIKNVPFLHYSLFSTDEEYKVVDPSSDFSNNVEALKDRYPFYWFAILQLVLLELLNKVVGKNKNAKVPKMHCLFKIPVNLIEEWRSTEQMNNLYIRLNKDNTFYNVDINFKNNPLPDLKIGGALPFVERFYTCDKGQAQILIFLFPKYAHKIEFISKG